MRTIQKTTLEYWALIAEIAGAIAIVVSVIYLRVQIRANTKAHAFDDPFRCYVTKNSRKRLRWRRHTAEHRS